MKREGSGKRGSKLEDDNKVVLVSLSRPPIDPNRQLGVLELLLYLPEIRGSSRSVVGCKSSSLVPSHDRIEVSSVESFVESSFVARNLLSRAVPPQLSAFLCPLVQLHDRKFRLARYRLEEWSRRNVRGT